MIVATTPRSERVRLFPCPKCGALGGRPCTTGGLMGPPRARHHIERVAEAQAWLGEQLSLDLGRS